MTIATYLGVVEDGRIRLCDDVDLTENTRVYVVVPESAPAPVRIRTPRLVDPKLAPRFVKQVVETQPNAEL